MSQSYRKIFLIFFIVVLLPTLIFTIYEIGSLRRNEAIIEDIYSNQLEAILYSVNQYADDILNDIKQDLSSILNKEKISEQEIINYLNANSAIINGFLKLNHEIRMLPEADRKNIGMIKELMTNNDSYYEQLIEYYNSGYAKIQSVPSSVSENFAMIFILEINNQLYKSGLIINSETFINEYLDPKIQEIASDQFIISVFDSINDKMIYSSEKTNPPTELKYKKSFWLFENYDLGIESTGQTIDDLVSDRLRRNIILIAIIDFLLIIGAFLIYKNIRRNMEFAQIKSDFISNVSHEIRTPLALISMYIETLDMGRVKTEEKRNEYYKIILDETTRLSGMVNKILNFSQIEKGKKEYSFSRSNLNNLVNEVFSTYRYHLDRLGFAYELIKNEELPDTMLDSEAVKDALRNLIDNAVKYSNNTKIIEVRTGQSTRGLFVRVSDQGIGLSEKDKKLIFDKFYRVTEGNLAHKAKGTGLGLTIVQHIMDAHHGKITLESSPGKGSTFTLYFPLVKELKIEIS